MLNELKLPRAGYRENNTTATLTDLGTSAYAWSSTTISDRVYSLAFEPSVPDARHLDDRVYAQAVRCFKNTSSTSADIQLTAVITSSGQTVRINKYFANAYTVNR